MLNTGYSVQEIIEYFKTYVPVKERIARKFKEYKELTEKLKNGKENIRRLILCRNDKLVRMIETLHDNPDRSKIIAL